MKSEFMSDFATFDARKKKQRIPAGNRDQAAEISQARRENLLFADNFLRLGPRGAVGLSARGLRFARLRGGPHDSRRPPRPAAERVRECADLGVAEQPCDA